MFQRRFLLAIVFCALLVLSLSSVSAFAFECAFDDTSKVADCTYLRPSVDTTHTLAIYCCGAESLFALPGSALGVWQMGERGVPEFFKQNSFEKYRLTCDVVVDGAFPIQHPTLDPGEVDCTGGGTDFATGIFALADNIIDFADYDADEDGIVDGFFFIIVGDYDPPRGCACLGDFLYKTQDTSATGDTIVVSGQRGVEVRVNTLTDREEFIHVCVHQWGHQFGLVDLHGT